MEQQYQDYYRAKAAAWSEFMQSVKPKLDIFQQHARTEAHKLSDKGGKYFPEFNKNIKAEIQNYINLCLPYYTTYLETYGAAFARDAMQQLAIKIDANWELKFNLDKPQAKKNKGKGRGAGKGKGSK